MNMVGLTGQEFQLFSRFVESQEKQAKALEKLAANVQRVSDSMDGLFRGVVDVRVNQ